MVICHKHLQADQFGRNRKALIIRIGQWRETNHKGKAGPLTELTLCLDFTAHQVDQALADG